MAASPDADERRARMNLLNALNGPRLTPPPTPPPPPAADDWWDRLYDHTTKPESKKKATRKRKPEPDAQWEDTEPVDETTPGAATRGRRNPARELHTAWAGFDRRTRWITLNGACAGAGWALGLVPLLHSWIADCGQHRGTTAAICLGGGLILTTAVLDGYPRVHTWWAPLTWVFRIPLASAVVALCLYAPGAAQ